MTEHRIAESLLKARVGVALVGGGGTGSQVLTGLARLDKAMRELGHPGGLTVTVFDPDTVTAANVGRQLFSPADIGHPKAYVLVHRINLWHGLDWSAVSSPFGMDVPQMFNGANRVQIVISCVDSAAARRNIWKQFGAHYSDVVYWLDCGNRRSDGQVVIGEVAERLPRSGVVKASRSKSLKAADNLVPRRLPHVMDVYPELADATIAEDDTPSCSLAESLERQDLFVNDHISRWALHLLWTLFRTGAIEHHGYVINLADGIVVPIPVPA